MVEELLFKTRDEASGALADRMAFCLAEQLAKQDAVSIVVGGGSSPARCFQFLSRKNLNWRRVQVVLSDERWVPSSHVDSNEKLVRETLLINSAGVGSVLAVYRPDETIEGRCQALESELPASGFASAMLGMGADGHFASLFPDSDNLRMGLDTDSTSFYLPVSTRASSHPRVSITLGALLKSAEIQLLFFGDDKREVYDKAKAGDETLPIAAVLKQQRIPVRLFWAP